GPDRRCGQDRARCDPVPPRLRLPGAPDRRRRPGRRLRRLRGGVRRRPVPGRPAGLRPDRRRPPRRRRGRPPGGHPGSGPVPGEHDLHRQHGDELQRVRRRPAARDQPGGLGLQRDHLRTAVRHPTALRPDRRGALSAPHQHLRPVQGGGGDHGGALRRVDRRHLHRAAAVQRARGGRLRQGGGLPVGLRPAPLEPVGLRRRAGRRPGLRALPGGRPDGRAQLRHRGRRHLDGGDQRRAAGRPVPRGAGARRRGRARHAAGDRQRPQAARIPAAAQLARRPL
ncbi:MAG: UDP-glucose 4-epimerase, partial [uncultured Friedmanniella sp.]